jgi:hypothetical protein
VFYAELGLTTDSGVALTKASTDFVRDGGVLGQWGKVPRATGAPWGLGRRAGERLLERAAESGGKVEVASDYTADFEPLELAHRGLYRHHALADALALRAGYLRAKAKILERLGSQC